MKIFFHFLLAGLILTAACQQFSEEDLIPDLEQKTQRMAFVEHIQGIVQTLNSLTPSEQVFLEELHQNYPGLDQLLTEAPEQELQQLRETGRNKILDKILLPIGTYTSLLEASLKIPESEELFPSSPKEIVEGFAAWSCKEICVIRAEKSRLLSISTCMSEKGEEHECREEADIRYFFFLTDCTGNC